MRDFEQYNTSEENVREYIQATNDPGYFTNLLLMLQETATQFISIPYNEMEAGILKALKDFAGHISADRAYWINFDHQTNNLSTEFEWHSEYLNSATEKMQNFPWSDCPFWMDRYNNGQSVVVANVTDLPGGRFRDLLKEQGVVSHVAFPMKENGKNYGFIGFDWIQKSHHCSAIEKNLIRRFVQILNHLSIRVKHEWELEEEKEKALNNNRLIPAFLASISHEIRTPLNMVIAFSEIVRKLSKDETLKEYINIINESGYSVLSITDDILSLALNEEKGATIRLQKIKMVELFVMLRRQLEEMLLKSGKSDSVRSVFTADEKLLEQTILTDKSKIRQVMTNLFKNAVKFTGEGEIELDCQWNEDKTRVEFMVKDSGIGIPREKQEAIFDFFKQGDESNSKKYGGIGIGLAISKKIAIVMGGELSVKSGRDKGSIFTFSIPASISSPDSMQDKTG